MLDLGPGVHEDGGDLDLDPRGGVATVGLAEVSFLELNAVMHRRVPGKALARWRWRGRELLLRLEEGEQAGDELVDLVAFGWEVQGDAHPGEIHDVIDDGIYRLVCLCTVALAALLLQ